MEKTSIPMWDHQKRALDYADSVEHPALFMEMRLGKSRVALTSAMNSGDTTLIECPYCVIDTWREELGHFGVGADDIAELTGTRENRLDLMRQNRPFSIVNKEGFRVIPEIGFAGWDNVIVDESTFLKAPPATKWSKTYGKRPNTSRWHEENFRDVNRRFILTGTPSPESELDLYQQLRFLAPGILGCNNYYNFRHKFFKRSKFNWTLTDEGEDFLRSRLHKWCFSLKRKDVGLDSRKVYERRQFKLPTKIRKVYDELKKNFVLSIDEDIKGVTDYAVTKWQWLRWICSGHDNGRGLLHDAKYSLLMDLLSSELKHDQAIIYCAYTHEIEMVSKLLSKASIPHSMTYGEISKEEIRLGIKAFKNGESRVMVCQPKGNEFGRNWSFCDTTIFFSTPDALLSRQQCEDRTVSVTQRSPQLYIDLQAENSIEESIYRSLLAKETKQEMVQRFIREGL